MPETSSANAAVVADHALADDFLHPAPAAPFGKLGNSQLRANEDLSSIFDQSIVRPPQAPLLALHVLPVAAPPSLKSDFVLLRIPSTISEGDSTPKCLPKSI